MSQADKPPAGDLTMTAEEAEKLLKAPAPAEVAPGALRVYRCYACPAESGRELGRDFVVTEGTPKCPKCQTAADHPRLGSLIVPVVLVHYEPPVAHQNVLVRMRVGCGSVACDPDHPAGPRTRTAERRAVTCPKCKAAEAYKTGDPGLLDPRYDLPVASVAGGVSFAELPTQTPKGG